jgi:hypothetical protein
MTQSLEFGEEDAERLRSRRRLNFANCFDSLAERQPGESRGARKSLGEKQHAVDGLPFRDLFNATIFVKEPWDRANDIFADSFEQKM